jgi:small subunit ribosomal protein S18
MPKKKMRRQIKKKDQTPAECFFCKEKKEPGYADTSALMRFVSDRGKMFSRSRSGVCAKHQRKLSENIKYARHLALLPYISRD